MVLFEMYCLFRFVGNLVFISIVFFFQYFCSYLVPKTVYYFILCLNKLVSNFTLFFIVFII